jgi:carbonic anhydrase
MDDLLPGYRRFRTQQWPHQREIFETLADHGQRPKALVIACSDSRCDPSAVFDAGPGELFVIRNVANLVPPYEPDKNYHGTSAALEFGVRALEVPRIVVMGHAMCGGINALMNGVPDSCPDFIAPWISIAAAAKKRVLACDDGTDPQRACEYEAVKLSLENLLTFPWIADRVRAGKLKLIGCLFDIRSGVLELLQPDGSFQPASQDFGRGKDSSFCEQKEAKKL